MHELSVAEEIISIVKHYLPPEDEYELLSVHVEIGKLSNILSDSLQFCFEALTADTPLRGAKLKINEIPITVTCEDCGFTSELDSVIFQCGKCKSTKLKMIKGNELKVSEIELND